MPLKTACLRQIRTFVILCYRYNSLSNLKVNDLSGLKHLELLMLHSNMIKTVEDSSFYDLTSLQVKHYIHFYSDNMLFSKGAVLGQNKLEGGPTSTLLLKVWLHKTLTLYTAKQSSLSWCASEFVGMFIYLYWEDEMTYCCCPVPSHLVTSIAFSISCVSDDVTT